MHQGYLGFGVLASVVSRNYESMAALLTMDACTEKSDDQVVRSAVHELLS